MSEFYPDQTWQRQAACRGPQKSVFFPPTHFEKKDERESRERRAKEICSECSVRMACLQYALQIREPNGVWGGMSESERKQIMARQAS
jgi:WhiB family transcriptional regulator, redox-sensing transcriptional regulator